MVLGMYRRFRNALNKNSGSLEVVVEALGVGITVFSIVYSANQLEEQIKEQKYTTQLQIVSDYFNEVSKMIAENKKIVGDKENKCLALIDGCDNSYDSVLVTRTQVLLDNLDDAELRGQVVRFLSKSGLGRMLQGQDTAIRGQSLVFDGMNMEGINLSDIGMENSDLSCMRLDKSNLIGSSLQNSEIRFTSLRGAKLAKTNFNHAMLFWVDLSGAQITVPSSELKYNNVDFTNAYIIFSDLRGMVGNTDNPNRKDEVDRFVAVLTKAKSLYGTLLDDDVLKGIEKEVGGKGSDKWKSLFLEPVPWLGAEADLGKKYRRIIDSNKNRKMTILNNKQEWRNIAANDKDYKKLSFCSLYSDTRN